MIRKEIDWEQRRYEIANDYFIHVLPNAKSAIAEADKLIAELKKTSK